MSNEQLEQYYQEYRKEMDIIGEKTMKIYVEARAPLVKACFEKYKAIPGVYDYIAKKDLAFLKGTILEPVCFSEKKDE